MIWKQDFGREKFTSIFIELVLNKIFAKELLANRGLLLKMKEKGIVI
jgi:hypothetical protein